MASCQKKQPCPAGMEMDRDHDERLLLLPRLDCASRPRIGYRCSRKKRHLNLARIQPFHSQNGKPPHWRLQPPWRVPGFWTAPSTSDHPLVDPRALPGPAMGILILCIDRNRNIGNWIAYTCRMGLGAHSCPRWVPHTFAGFECVGDRESSDPRLAGSHSFQKME